MQDFAVRKLAPFKVPRRVFFVAEIPKGPTGKVQRVSMSEILGVEMLSPATSGDGGGPHSLLEGALVRLWADALELPMSAVGVDDDFFALGGDSLRGAGVVARIRDLLADRRSR